MQLSPANSQRQIRPRISVQVASAVLFILEIEMVLLMLFTNQRVGMEQGRVVVGKRILLVEDERWVRECIKRLLWLDSHTVTEAADGMEAVELFDRAKFDVVITDFDMPRMAGDKLVASIRRRAPAQPIILITAGVERFIDHENPAYAILGKPFGVAELRETLSKLLSEGTAGDVPVSKDGTKLSPGHSTALS